MFNPYQKAVDILGFYFLIPVISFILCYVLRFKYHVAAAVFVPFLISVFCVTVVSTFIFCWAVSEKDIWDLRNSWREILFLMQIMENKVKREFAKINKG